MIMRPIEHLRALSLVRVVTRRSRSDWPLVLATWLLLACSTSLITAAAIYSESVSLGGLRTALSAAAPSETAVRITATVPAGELAPADAALSSVIDRLLGSGGTTSRIATTDSLSAAGVEASDQTRQILVGAYDGVADHATLEAGSWPEPGSAVTEAALSVGAAAAMGFSLGDRVALTSKLDASRRLDVAIVGLWRPDPNDRYWLGSPLELSGIRTSGAATTRGPLVVSAQDLPALAGSVNLNVEWRWLPALASLRPSDRDRLRTAITTLTDEVPAAYEGATVRSGLPALLDDSLKALLVAGSSILLLFAQFALLAGYAVLLMAGILVEWRRAETAVLRARGASSSHIALVAGIESALLAVPAVVVAPFVAQVIVGLMGRIGPLARAGLLAPVGIDATAVVAAVGSGIACILVLTLPAISRSAAGRGPVFGHSTSGHGRRLWLDLILVGAAALAIWQLQLYGAPLTRTVRGELGIDPLLVVAPAMGLLAGAFVATRVLPRLLRLGEWLTTRSGVVTTGTSIWTGSPSFGRLALLLTLAASLGTFAATFETTWSGSQVSQAAYQAAADERLTVDSYPALPEWALGPAYAAIAGVTETTPVVRESLDVGRDVGAGMLLAVDPRASAVVAAPGQGGSAGDDTKAIAAARAIPLQPIPGTPTRLAVTFDSAVAGLGGVDLRVMAPTSVNVSVVLDDANGLHRFAGGSVSTAARNARVTVDLTTEAGGTTYVPAYPLRLEAVEFLVTAALSDASGFEIHVAGSIELTGVEANGGSDQAGWRPVGLRPGASGWAWNRVDRQTLSACPNVPGHPGQVSIGDGPDQTPTVVVDSLGHSGAVFRYWAVPPTGAIPALANPVLLDATGVGNGDMIMASRSGFRSPVRIVGTTARFPTLDPDQPFLVVDRGALQMVDYATWGILDNPTEWWLTVESGRGQEVATKLRAWPYSAANVIARADLESSMLADPVALGMIGALGLGSIAAVILAVVGFLVTIAFAARRRDEPPAGWDPRGTARARARLLTVEAVLLLGYGLIAGVALGLLLGWLSIPFSSLSSTGAPAVPAAVMAVPWRTIVLVEVPIAVVLALGAWLIVRVATRSVTPAAAPDSEVQP